MIPKRRNLRFRLQPEQLIDWHARGSYVTHFAHALSISFPDGERYFIHTLRNYRDRITDPALQNAVTAFIGQEAMHSREHEEYNRLLDQIGLPARALSAHAASGVEWLKRWLPPPLQLSITIAQEHCTAIFAERVLCDPAVLAGADPRLAALWRWHSLEEIEHKAVAFDVYIALLGRGWAAHGLRCAGLVMTTVGFLSLILYYQQRLAWADPRQTPRWRDFRGFLDFMLRSPGLLPVLARPWRDYFRRDFHPWDHDNRNLLAQIDEVLRELGQAPQPRTASWA